MATRKCGNIYFPKYFMVVRPFLTSNFFQELFGLERSKHFLENFRQVHNLKISNRLLRFKSFFQKNIPGFICSVCVCVFSSHSFWTSSSLDAPAGVTQEEGHTGFLIHLLSAVRAFIFLARRIQLSFLSLVDREVEFCVLTI